MKYPTIKTREAARRFLAKLHESNPYPCCHGHCDCSTEDRGPCLDETLTTFPELAE